jgi:hypothetical protein
MQVHSTISTSVNFNVNYNKKSYQALLLWPKQYQLSKPNVDYSGNEPAAYDFDNYEVKLSAFDYAFISYNISSAKNQVINRVTLNNDVVINTNENIPKWRFIILVWACQFRILFTKGFAETMKMNVNPDTMNFFIRVYRLSIPQIQMLIPMVLDV